MTHGGTASYAGPAQGWLRRHAGFQPRLTWQVADYRQYVQTVSAWSSVLEVAATDAEYLMFADAASDEPASPWAVPWLTTPSDGGRGAAAPGAAARIAAGPPGAGMASVLDALDEAATAFAALPGDTALVDAEDFDRGIRQLRRIVLAAGIRGEVAGTAIEPAGT